MLKYKDIEFLTIFSQEIIKDKLEKIICSDSIFDKKYSNKELTGNINLYDFIIHNIKSIWLHRGINYWRILIKGTIKNDGNLTNVKIRIRILHGEIIYMYSVFLIILTISGLKSIISIIAIGILF